MTVSDSELHAYVDDELTEEQFVRVANVILSSEELFDHVSDLQTLKQLFRQACETVPTPNER